MWWCPQPNEGITMRPVQSRILSSGSRSDGGGTVETIMLVLAGVVTAVPLLAFAYASNRITLQRMGFPVSLQSLSKRYNRPLPGAGAKILRGSA